MQGGKGKGTLIGEGYSRTHMIGKVVKSGQRFIGDGGGGKKEEEEEAMSQGDQN